MPIKQEKKIYPWIYHGDKIDLNTLSRQNIRVIIRFPYRENNGKWDLDPLTVNLLKDIGISPNSRVYAVDWNDPIDNKITMNNGMIPYMHNHTYKPGIGNDSNTKTYNIIIYGDDLITYRGFEKEVGQEPTGFKISCELVESVPVRKRFIIDGGNTDKLIPGGARINRAFWGKHLVYSKNIQGSTLKVDIIIDGNNHVRLYNPLIKDMNNWENVRTDLEIDWGDGQTTQWYNRRVNSGLFNSNSKYIPEHTYNANTGDRFTITIKGVEPLLPTGTTVDKLYGSFPEDCYCGNEHGLLSYSEEHTTEWRELLSRIRFDITNVGESLLDNWVNTTDMEYMFSNWYRLREVPRNFFKSNILDSCKNYNYCFYDCTNLEMVDPYLLGSENNVVKSTDHMFFRTGVTETIKLKSSSSLISAANMYNLSYVESADEFLVDVPNLEIIDGLFNTTDLHNYNSTLLQNSPKIKSARGFMSTCGIREIYVNMTQWSYIEDLTDAYSLNVLNNINDGIFGGDFAKNTPVNTLKMSNIFDHIGTVNNYCEVHSKAFRDLVNVTDKLYDVQHGWIRNSYIDKLYDGLFDGIFDGQTSRFELDYFMAGVKTKDDFGYDDNYIYVPEMFRKCNAVKSVYNILAETNIGYLSQEFMFGMVLVENVSEMFRRTFFHCRFPEKFFLMNKLATNWTGLFKQSYFKYSEVPIDDIIWSEIDSVNVNEMLCSDSEFRCYRLFGHSSTVKNVNGTTLFNYTPSIPHTRILRGRTHRFSDDIEVRELIYVIATRAATNINYSNTDTSVIGYVSIDGADYQEVDFSTYRIGKLPVGSHVIKIKCSEPIFIIPRSGMYEVAYIGGEFPYNSKIEQLDFITPREVDRYVFAACDPNSLHNVASRWDSFGILHKDIFKYHDEVTHTEIYNDGDYHNIYALQPRIYEHMINLNDFTCFFNNKNRVISDLHLPQFLNNVVAIQGSKFVGTIANGLSNRDRQLLTNVYVQRNAFLNKDYEVVEPNLGNMQVNTPDNSYLEFRLSATVGTIGFIELDGAPIYPITVETLHKGDIKPSKHVLNSVSDKITISGETFVRVFANKPVWIDQPNQQYITELFGCIPECDFTWKFKDIAPNLKRVGELIFIYCQNESFVETFKGLQHFEYFPGTLFWYNYKATNYESCFEDCPALFKVDDYIITDKIGDINCRNMFKNSGVTNVRRPIMDDINGKVVVDGMFDGCKTDFWYGHTDLDEVIFKNIDTFGKSGIVFSGSNSQPTDNWFCDCVGTDEVLSRISYYYVTGLLKRYTKYGSQSIMFKLWFNNEYVTTSDTRYLPFVNYIGKGTTKDTLVDVTADLPEDYFMYAERLGTTYIPTGTINNIKWNKSAYYRCNDITKLYEPVQETSPSDRTFNNTIQDMIPYNCKALKTAKRAFWYTTLSIPDGYQLPEHSLYNIEEMFKISNIHVPYGFFDNVRKDIIGTEYVKLSGIFEQAIGLVEETGVFRAYGSLVDPVNTTHVYSESSISTLQPDKVYEGCEHMEVLDYHFDRCANLSILPNINHMTNVYSYQHMFEMSNILDIPEHYVYTLRDDRDIMLDYMFANCPELFFTNVWIDPRCPGYFSIDYSLNEVFSAIGDDPEIFGHIKYDTEWEHRSRVFPFDTRVTWEQWLEVVEPNTTVKLTGLYHPDLVGFDPEELFAVTWGDTKQTTVVRDGGILTADHITHTYKETGRFLVKVMLRNDCTYIETPAATENKIRTVDLTTSFKFGNINDIKTKGLRNMFGTYVEHVNKDLFVNLEGIDTIEIYNEMFMGFDHLGDLEVGVLDCMPNITTLSSFLTCRRTDGINLVLKKGLFDKLTKLRSINTFSHVSNISELEEGLFDNNIELEDMAVAFTGSKLTEAPRNLLHKLTKLKYVQHLFWSSIDFVLDSSYDDFFKYNSMIINATECFCKVQIHEIPVNIMKPLVNLEVARSIFAADENPGGGEFPDNNTIVDINDLVIPDGFLSANVKLRETYEMFAGRKSIKSYPADILDYCRGTLVNTYGMFTKTGISVIHEGTFDGHTTNIDARYMFYGDYVRNCPRPIINSTGTFSTYGMLYRVSGLPTEEELFSGVKTNPADIQSMYRQEFEWYVMEGEFSGSLYLKACENSFPWNGYTIDIDPGDGNIITIEKDIADQATLTTLTTFTAAGNTIRVKAPFIIELGGGSISYNVLSGVLGRMITTNHTAMSTTGYNANKTGITIDGKDFYKRNKHITSMNSAFNGTPFEYFATDVFTHLTNVTSMKTAFHESKFKIKDGYKPNFDHMKLTNISQAFENNYQLVINKDWEPFKNIPTIQTAVNVFARSGIITTPYVNTTSLLEAQGMYWMCSELTTTYADIINGASKCWNFYGMIGNCPKLSIIEGETDSHTIGDTSLTITRDVDYKQMFINNTSMTQQQIARIINNLGVWKASTQCNVNISDMFAGCVNANKGDVKTPIRINSTNKNVDATRCFYGDKLMNVPIGGITLTGNSSLAYTDMFYNCFAAPEVKKLGEVFVIGNMSADTDWRSSQLDTLNVFRIKVTPEEEDPNRRQYWINNSVNESLVVDITPMRINSINMSDDYYVTDIVRTYINMSKEYYKIDIEPKEE